MNCEKRNARKFLQLETGAGANKRTFGARGRQMSVPSLMHRRRTSLGDENGTVAVRSLVDGDERWRDGVAATVMTAVPGRTEQSSWLDGPYLRSAVHGALDGLITTFTTICASVGVRITVLVIVVMTAANLVGDGVSLAVADVVSTGVARRHAREQMARVERRLRADRHATADAVARRLLGDDGDVHAVHALPDRLIARLEAFDTVNAAAPGTIVGVAPRRQWAMLARQGLVTAVAFIAFGSAPVLALLVGDRATAGTGVHGGFAASAVVTVTLLFAIGAFNARFMHTSSVRGGALVLLTALPTTLLVLGLSVGIVSLVPESLREAHTCGDLGTWFIRAPER